MSKKRDKKRQKSAPIKSAKKVPQKRPKSAKKQMVAGDSFMLKFLSVMKHLSSKASPQIGP